MKRVALFPGQGSQKVGMGKQLADNFEIARRTFEEADEALGMALSGICFDGPAEELGSTAITQPAILTTSIAALRVARAERGLTFDVAAGHSLGEWSALVAVGALELADAVRLVNVRGMAMQEAVPAGQGAMAAILGLELAAVQEVCDAAAAGQVCSPANLNGGGQVVISGHKGAIERAVVLAKERGAKRAVPLAVSAPFHCALMAPAARAVEEALAEVAIGELSAPVVANFDAELNRDKTRVAQLLVAQVTGTVRWEESVLRLQRDGVVAGYELGEGAVLRGLVRRIAAEINVSAVGTPADIEALEV